MCDMEQVLRVFMQNTNLEHTYADSQGNLATKQWPLVAPNLVLLELLERRHLLTSMLAPLSFESGSAQLPLQWLSLPFAF